MQKILITGISGFVGSHLADYLVDKCEVHGLIRWRSPLDNIKQLLGKIELHHGDVLDYPSLYGVLERVKPDVIFHLAAQSYVPYSTSAPISTLTINAIGTCNLLEAVKNLKIEPIVHICSSSEVYGSVWKDEVPITEDAPLRPASLYAVSKVTEDRLAYQYFVSFGIKCIITRMFTHTGPRRGEVFVVSNFAKQIAEIEKGKEPVIKVGNLDSVRTWLDVKDAVKAYWLLVNKCVPGEVYNIGGVEVMTIRKMLDKLIALSTVKNIRVEVDPDRLRPSDVTLQIPCIDKFTRATNWRPEIPFDTTLKNVLQYWREKV